MGEQSTPYQIVEKKNRNFLTWLSEVTSCKEICMFHLISAVSCELKVIQQYQRLILPGVWSEARAPAPPCIFKTNLSFLKKRINVKHGVYMPMKFEKDEDILFDAFFLVRQVHL